MAGAYRLLRRLDLEDKGESEWPDVSDAALLERLEEWLPAYLGKVTRLAHFANLDLASILAGLLPWPLPQRLDEWAPKTLEVPSGSRIRLDYSETPPISRCACRNCSASATLRASPRAAWQ